MPILQGVKLEIISKKELEIFPEFLPTDNSRSDNTGIDQDSLSSRSECPATYHLAESQEEGISSKGTSISIYIPAPSNAQFFIRYHILEGAPDNVPFYYFKLLMNGREITSWGCSARSTTTGHITRALFDPSDEWTYEDEKGQVYKRCGVEPRAFYFAKYNQNSSPATDGGLIQVCIFRSMGRFRRVQEPGTYKNQEPYGIALTSNGLLDDPQNAKFYDYHLKDAKDSPYIVFNFHYRSWGSLANLNLIPENYSRKLLPMSPSLQDLSGLSRETQGVLQERNFTLYAHQNVDIAQHLRDTTTFGREGRVYHRNRTVDSPSDSSASISSSENHWLDDSYNEFKRSVNEDISRSKSLTPELGDGPLPLVKAEESTRKHPSEETLTEATYDFPSEPALRNRDKSTGNEDVCETILTSRKKRIYAPHSAAGSLVRGSRRRRSPRLAFIKARIAAQFNRFNKHTTKKVTSKPAFKVRPLPDIPVRKPSLDSRPLPGPFRSGYGRGRPGFATSPTLPRLPTIHSEGSDLEEEFNPKPNTSSHRETRHSTPDGSDAEDCTLTPISKFNIGHETRTQDATAPRPSTTCNTLRIPSSRPSLVSKFNSTGIKQESAAVAMRGTLLSGDDYPNGRLRSHSLTSVKNRAGLDNAEAPKTQETTWALEQPMSMQTLDMMNIKPLTLPIKAKSFVADLNNEYKGIPASLFQDDLTDDYSTLASHNAAFNAKKYMLPFVRTTNSRFKDTPRSMTPESSYDENDKVEEPVPREEISFEDREKKVNTFTRDKDNGRSRSLQPLTSEPYRCIPEAQWMKRTAAPLTPTAMFAPQAPHHGPRLGSNFPASYDPAFIPPKNN